MNEYKVPRGSRTGKSLLADKMAEYYLKRGRSVFKAYLDEQGEIATKLIKPEEFVNTEPPKE